MRVRQSSFRSGIVLASLLGCMPATANPDNPDTDGDGVADASDLFPDDDARSDLVSYRIVLDVADEGSDTSATIAGDLDRDGSPEIVIASPRQPSLGAVYVISTADLADADGADGVRDGSIARTA